MTIHRGRGRNVAWAQVLCATLAALPAHAFNPNNPAASGYVETLATDFHTINRITWENDWWYDQAGETACQTDFLPAAAVASAAGLHLHMESLENFPACSGVERYSYAHLDSYNGFSQKYGYFEASIKSSPLHGTLTAFWLLPESGAWPPEIDIEEIRGNVPRTAYLTNHTGQNDTQVQFLYTAPSNLGDAYHVYGVLLTPAAITWYVDGTQRGQTARGADEAVPMFIIFSLYTGACGDGWAGCPTSATGWSADAYVRWLRVWKPPGD